jgi:hypothetical protein
MSRDARIWLLYEWIAFLDDHFILIPSGADPSTSQGTEG